MATPRRDVAGRNRPSRDHDFGAAAEHAGDGRRWRCAPARDAPTQRLAVRRPRARNWSLSRPPSGPICAVAGHRRPRADRRSGCDRLRRPGVRLPALAVRRAPPGGSDDARPPIDLRSDTLSPSTPANVRGSRRDDRRHGVTGRGRRGQPARTPGQRSLGKEACVVPAERHQRNLLALLAQAPRGTAVLMDRIAHQRGRVVRRHRRRRAIPWTLKSRRGSLDPADVKPRSLIANGGRTPPISTLVLENTHNFAGGVAITSAETTALADVAHRYGAAVHLDGARLPNAPPPLACRWRPRGAGGHGRARTRPRACAPRSGHCSAALRRSSRRAAPRHHRVRAAAQGGLLRGGRPRRPRHDARSRRRRPPPGAGPGRGTRAPAWLRSTSIRCRPTSSSPADRARRRQLAVAADLAARTCGLLPFWAVGCGPWSTAASGDDIATALDDHETLAEGSRGRRDCGLYMRTAGP